MKKLPMVSGLVLCQRMDVDKTRKEISLVGIFHAMRLRLPSPPQQFTVYGTFFDGEGEGVMKLEVTRLETERIIYRRSDWIAIGSRGLLSHREIKVNKCIFPAAGRYIFVLSIDGTELARHFLDILPETPRP